MAFCVELRLLSCNEIDMFWFMYFRSVYSKSEVNARRPHGRKVFCIRVEAVFCRGEDCAVWLCVPGNVAGFCCNSHAGELLHDFANADYVLTGTRDKSFGTSSVFSSAPLLEGPKITRLP